MSRQVQTREEVRCDLASKDARKRRERLFASVAFTVALTSAVDAHAQATPSSATVEEIVVTAQRKSENLQQVPITVQAITAAAIQNLGIKSSTDLSQFTPNVAIATPAGEGNQPIITIRGIGLNDYNSNNSGPNGVYIDEVYLSAPGSQTFQVFDLEQIEVLKGPQGTLYGRNTSGGAINFISTKPSDVFTADAHLSYSSFNTFNFEGAVGGPITSNLSGRIAVTTKQSDGYMHNSLTGQDENGANSYAARAQLLYKASDALKVLLTLHGGYVDNRPTEYRHVGSINPATGAYCSVSATLSGQCIDALGYGTPSGFYDGAWNRQQHLRIRDWGASARVDYTPGPITFTSLTALTHNDRFHPEDSDASPNRLIEINYGVQSNTITQEFRASQTTSRFDWVAGAYLLHEILRQDQPSFVFLDIDKIYGAHAGDGTAFVSPNRNRQGTDSYAVYGQGDYNLTDRLKLTVGGRYSSEKKTFAYTAGYAFQAGGIDHFAPVINVPSFGGRLRDDAFNYRLALNYAATDDLRVYASVASGFKSGGFNGGFLSADPSEIAVQLTPVSPEHVTAFEVGVKADLLDRRLRVNASVFYNDYRDMQVFTLIPSPIQNIPLNVLDNAPKAHTQGLDLSIIGKPVGWITITQSLGLLDTRLDRYTVTRDPRTPDYSGNKLPLAPEVSASTIVEVKREMFGGTTDLQLSANYKSKQFFDTSNNPLTTQKPYWIANARLGYSPDQAAWEAAVFVRNLNDQKYLVDAFDLSTPFGVVEQIVGVPRSVGVELNYKF